MPAHGTVGEARRESPGRAPFVGRQAEFSELALALDEAIEGQGSGYLILGEAGMGKTRIATELASHAGNDGLLVLWGRCWEAGGAPPYWPFTEVLRRAETVGAPPFQIAHSTNRFELFGAVADHLRAIAADRPTLVIIDDLHAADVASLLLLEHLLGGALWQSRIACVALAREHELMRTEEGQRLRRLARTLRLGGLTRKEVAALVAQRANEPLAPETVDAVFEASEGNPLFVEELAMLTGREPGQVPAGIRDVLRQRLAPLRPETLGVLAAGAVMGREFDLELVARLRADEPGRARAAIDEAVRAEIVALTGADRYRFRHILVRDVLYEDLPATDRARLHAGVGEALEQRTGIADHLDELAHHFVAAGDAERPRALRYLLEAAEQAEARLAHERAAAHYEHALELVDPIDEPLRCDVLLSLGRAAGRAGRADQAAAAFRLAADSARRLGDGVRFARAVLGASERVAFQQHDQGAIASLQEALETVPAEDMALRARLFAALARNFAYAGMATGVVDAAGQAVRAARAAGDSEVLGDALAAWQLTLWTPDHVAERLQIATELLELGGQTGDRERMLEAHMARMICHLEMGDGRELDRSLAAYSRQAEELRQPRYRFIAQTRRAMRALMQGDRDGGRRLAEQARRLGAECGEPDAEPVYYGLLALPARDDGVGLEEVERFFVDFSTRHTSAGSGALLTSLALARGDNAAARRDLDRLAGLVDELPRDLDWLFCLGLCAEGAHALDDVPLARKLYPLLVPYEDRCAMIAGAVGFAGSIAHYLALLATTLGRPTDAERHRGVALRTYRALGARPWIDRIENACAAHPSATTPTGVAVLHRQGDRWLVGYGDARFELADTKGLRHLAALLSQPGRELHVLDLAAPVRVDEGDTGPLLDAAAKHAYRRRLEELRDDIDEAEAWADPERAARAQTELEAVTAELIAAAGLGGRDRRASTNVDRARVSVRKAIVRARREIGQHDPALARYLETTVRTGTYCIYEPDPRFPTTWDVTA